MKDTECEIIGIISPAGCENCFREVAANGSASRSHRFK